MAGLGEGHLDALFGMAGLVAGSYLCAEASGNLDRSVAKWGLIGKMTLPQLFGLPVGPFVLGFSLILASVLFLVEYLTA